MESTSQYKDSLFRRIFNEKENLLSLYNGLNNTSYTDTEDIRLNTIEDTIINGLRNDVSFSFRGKQIVLIEHQSTVNNNMPMRCLLYMAKIYSKELDVKDLYKENLKKIAMPKFYVMYNGIKNQEYKRIFKLSDAFEKNGEEATIELKVTAYNINHEKNGELLKKCSILNEYSEFVRIVREEYEKKHNRDEAIKRAIEICKEKGILKKYIDGMEEEVFEVAMREITLEDLKQVWMEEAREEGREEQNLKNTINLLKVKVPLQQISDALKVSVERIKEIAKENNIKITKEQLKKGIGGR